MNTAIADKIEYMYVNNVLMDDIARKLGLERRVIYRHLAKKDINSLPPSDDELACSNPTEGFLNYLERDDAV